MSRFEHALLDVDSRLTVSEPSRSRILLEIASDMEGLFQAYRSRGMDEPEAEAAALDHFDLSEETLADLVQVHDTTLERSLEELTGPVRGSWARLLMVALAIFVVGGSAAFLMNPDLYRTASRVVLVILPLLTWGLWVAGRQAVTLVRAKGSWSPRLRGGLNRLLGLALTIVLVAGGGLLLELYLGALRIREVPREALIHFVAWLHLASATMVVALSGALMLAFLWFFLDAQTRRLERVASQTLLGGLA
jgi:hypothetical protein